MSEPTGESRAPLEPEYGSIAWHQREQRRVVIGEDPMYPGGVLALTDAIHAAMRHDIRPCDGECARMARRALAAQPPSGDAPDLGSEYGRLIAQRDRLVASGVDPADLDLPLALSTDLAGDETSPPR